MAIDYCIQRIENRQVFTFAFDRYITKIRISENSLYQGTPCWEWTGSTNPITGYGEFKIDARRGATIKRSSPHRFIYQYLIGEIHEGYEVDHLCHNRLCSNPVHLQLLTHKDNSRRRRNCRNVAGACKNGHEASAANTYTAPSGRTCCRICRDEAVRRFHDKKPNYYKNKPATRIRRNGVWVRLPS